MSVQHLCSAMFGCPGLDPATRLVLIHLANNADPETSVTDGDVDWIISYTGLTAGQVYDAYGQLQRAGLIEPTGHDSSFFLDLPDEEA